MATIAFNKPHSVNGKQYKKGDVLSVSPSVSKVLLKEGIASKSKKPVKKAKKEN